MPVAALLLACCCPILDGLRFGATPLLFVEFVAGARFEADGVVDVEPDEGGFFDGGVDVDIVAARFTV